MAELGDVFSHNNVRTNRIGLMYMFQSLRQEMGVFFLMVDGA